MAPLLFRILVVAIIFSLTVDYYIVADNFIGAPIMRNNTKQGKKVVHKNVS